MLTRAQREELKALSKEVFGVSSKYQKLMDGVRETVTKEVEEEVPGEDGAEPTKRTVKVAVLDEQGIKKTVIKRYSFEEVRDLLLGFKTKLEAFRAEQMKAQEEAAAKKAQEELQSEVHKKLSGSAV